MIEFRLFGPLSIRDSANRDLRPKLLKSRAILAILAATPGHRHSRSWLQSLLWEDRQQAQAMSSLRSALADIRRHLGAEACAFHSDHLEVALDPSLIRVTAPQPGTQEVFLEGLDIRNADGFEDWLRLRRNEVKPAAAEIQAPTTEDATTRNTIFLASSSRGAATITQMQCDALVDCIVKSVEDLDLAGVIDGRGRGTAIEDIRGQAANAGCDYILISETAENASGSFTRLKVLDCETASLVWSRSLVGHASLDLDDAANVAVVAEFIEVLTDRLVRPLNWQTDVLSPQLMALTGINHIFKLGQTNFDTADLLLKRACFENPTGATLAWRAFLRTFMIGERAYENRDDVVEEGTDLARRALDADPLNSVVLSLCAHVENMLHDNYEGAFDLSARALALNRCNPIAWASLGRAASSLGEIERGRLLAQYGAKLANGTKYSFLVDSWASSSGLIAQDLVTARLYCELSHAKAPTFSPPLRFLSALYFADAQIDRAQATVAKLKKQEPDFSLMQLREESYPSSSLRQARLLDNLPATEI